MKSTKMSPEKQKSYWKRSVVYQKVPLFVVHPRISETADDGTRHKDGRVTHVTKAAVESHMLDTIDLAHLSLVQEGPHYAAKSPQSDVALDCIINKASESLDEASSNIC